jgi:ParB family chromosome partitioning protein
MTPPPVAPIAIQTLPLSLIDEPELVMRETMSDEGLQSLASSIRALGLLQNIGVVKAGDRYRVAYGHRRRIAAEIAGLTELPCIVYPEGTTDEEARKVAENTEREDVNPAAEATYFHWLFNERCGQDVERLARLVGKSEEYVQGRFDLLRGDPEVLAAIRRSEISLAVARQLNRVKNPMYRRMFLEDAIVQGMSERAVRTLREQLERQEALQAAGANPDAVPVPPSTESPIVNVDECPLCESSEDPHDMEYVRVHRSCRAALRRQRRTRAREEGEA